MVLSMANSLDLTERTLPALKCRGCQPDMLLFPAYTKTQVGPHAEGCCCCMCWQVVKDRVLCWGV